MNALRLASLRARIDAWLGATSLGRRLTLLSLLSVAGLTMLLALNLLFGSLCYALLRAGWKIKA